VLASEDPVAASAAVFRTRTEEASANG
jgi:hypothetical protein